MLYADGAAATYRSGEKHVVRDRPWMGATPYPETPKTTFLEGSEIFIGAPGFEPGTSPTRTVRATRLRHAPRASQLNDANLAGGLLAGDRLEVAHRQPGHQGLIAVLER